MEEGAVRTFACLALLITDLGLAATMAALVGRWQIRNLASSWAAGQCLRLHRGLTAGLATAVAGHAIGLMVQVMALSEEGRAPSETAMKLLADTRYGHAWAAGLLGLALLAIAWRRSVHGSTALAWCAVVLFASARASASHAARQEGAALQIAAQAAHVMATSTWLGTVVAASRVRLPGIGDAVSDRTEAAAWVQRLSTAASAALAILLVAGVLRGWNGLASWAALVTSEYGRLLMVKLAFVMVAAALGGANRFFVLPPLLQSLRIAKTLRGNPAEMFRRILIVEAVMLLGALSVATILATSETPSQD